MLMDRCLMKAQRNAWHHKPGTAEHEDRSLAQQLPGMPLAPHHGLAGQKDVLLGHDHVSCLVLNGLDHLGVAVARGDNANACKERQGASVQAGVSSQSAGLAGALTRGHVKMFAAIAGPDVAALGPLRDVLLQHKCAEGSVSHQKAFVLQGMQ